MYGNSVRKKSYSTDKSETDRTARYNEQKVTRMVEDIIKDTVELRMSSQSRAVVNEDRMQDHNLRPKLRLPKLVMRLDEKELKSFVSNYKVHRDQVGGQSNIRHFVDPEFFENLQDKRSKLFEDKDTVEDELL